MNQGFGHEVPAPHVQGSHRGTARYLVVIPAPGGPLAKFFLDTRVLVSEMDANTADVTAMTMGLTPAATGTSPEWDQALSGHSPQERAEAQIYSLAL